MNASTGSSCFHGDTDSIRDERELVSSLSVPSGDLCSRKRWQCGSVLPFSFQVKGRLYISVPIQ